MTQQTLISGVELKLGRSTYIVPPLNIAGHKRFRPFFQQAMRGEVDPNDLANFDAVAEIVHCALVRNYPELTLEQVEFDLDPVNIGRAFEVVLGAAGFEPVPPGEARPGTP